MIVADARGRDRFAFEFGKLPHNLAHHMTEMNPIADGSGRFDRCRLRRR